MGYGAYPLIMWFACSRSETKMKTPDESCLSGFPYKVTPVHQHKKKSVIHY